MKKLFTFFLSALLFFSFVRGVYAVNDPLSVPNNSYGIHIFDENDLNDAARLVNSSGGDWGYVTFVITEGERDHDRWQRVFDKMRRLHLIPIVRIATKADGDTWQKPSEAEINNWIAFLNSLNWVVQNRYVIIGNEPNHSLEWGGSISPEDYASYFVDFSKALKAANEDFFVLPAGLDASAGNTQDTLEESTFIRRMLKAEPLFFDNADGWVSHSYPNPDFSGSQFDQGKGTTSTFSWELYFLKTLGIIKDLPVFITETGWSHKTAEDEIAKRLIYTFQNTWKDKRIVAVTPFILNYTTLPFDNFSWKKSDGSFYTFYDTVSKLAKIKGEPKQDVKGRILGVFVNPLQIVGSNFSGAILVQNLGQSIWSSVEISVGDESVTIPIKVKDFEGIEPQKLTLLTFESNVPSKAGTYKIPFVLQSKGKNISDSYPYEIAVIEKPEEKKVSSFVKLTSVLISDIRSFWYGLKLNLTLKLPGG